MKALFKLFFAMIIGIALLASCGSDDDTGTTTTPPADEMTLYKKLGGAPRMMTRPIKVQ